jgi:competence protein ComEC
MSRDMLSENGGVDDALVALSEQPGARCSPDLCLIDVTSGTRHWRVAATRSSYLVPWKEMVALCRSVDIVVSDRRLPPGCAPRWLKLDREMLARTGGIAISFADGRVRAVSDGAGKHPWVDPVTAMPSVAPQNRPRGN